MASYTHGFNAFELQIWLHQFGPKEIAIDGVVGPQTKEAVKNMLTAFGKMPLREKADPMLAFEQLVMREVAGLAVGPIDGFYGPATEKARKHWVNNNWRSSTMRSYDGDARMPAALKKWPLQSEMREFYGEPGEGIIMQSAAFPLRLSWDLNTTVMRYQCHKKVAPAFLRVQKELLRVYGHDGIEELRIDVFGGCFNIRNMRGGAKLSTHAFGAAWDTDPVNNALRTNHKRAALAGPKYKFFWKAWTAEGFLSLGKARDFDWMHTQAARLG